MRQVAFVALGSNVPDAQARFALALKELETGGDRIAAVSLPVLGPYELAPGRPTDRHPPVLDGVVELATSREPHDLLERLHEIERQAGRVRGQGAIRTLDLDLLTWGDATSDADPMLPHPRARERAFVLAPWESITPLASVPGTDATVVELAQRLRHLRPADFRALTWQEAVPPPDVGSDVVRLESVDALRRWRAGVQGTVGVVPTMGALHPGHASLIRRAYAECDHVLATIFVNPLQFGEGEDLGRYPRTLDRDLDVLRRGGADAVFLPAPDALYPDGFATRVVPGGPAEGFEGARRPGHFEGVATVVLKLWMLTRPDVAYFGQKDAQQLAVIRRMAKDLHLPGRIRAGATVHAPDGLALSSRNRYLTPDERTRALALPRMLEQLAFDAAAGPSFLEDAKVAARRGLEVAGLAVDYLEVVDPSTLEATRLEAGPGLAIATVRVGRTRLLDNRFVAVSSEGEDT